MEPRSPNKVRRPLLVSRTEVLRLQGVSNPLLRACPIACINLFHWLARCPMYRLAAMSPLHPACKQTSLPFNLRAMSHLTPSFNKSTGTFCLGETHVQMMLGRRSNETRSGSFNRFLSPLEPEGPADPEGVFSAGPGDIMSSLRCGPGLFDIADGLPIFVFPFYFFAGLLDWGFGAAELPRRMGPRLLSTGCPLS